MNCAESIVLKTIVNNKFLELSLYVDNAKMWDDDKDNFKNQITKSSSFICEVITAVAQKGNDNEI